MEKTEDKGLRCYFMNIFYFGGIQAGIQAQHAATRLSRKYDWVETMLRDGDTDAAHQMSIRKHMVEDWADNHETSIVLNAGMHGDLVKLEEFLDDERNTFPWARFNESKYAANGCYTSIAIVLPERIFDPEIEFTPKGEDNIYPHLTEWETEFYNKLRRMSLMR